MATHRISLLGANTVPDASGNVFFEPYNIKATNDVFRQMHVVFNDSGTRILLYGIANVPKNYVGTATVIIVWTSTATSGDVVWDFDYRAVGGNDSESLDQATVQEGVTVTDTAPGATDRRMEVSISLTSANIVADDTLEWIVGRDGAQGADTMAAAAQLVGLYLQYADA
jgi:hypothetical protein